MDGLRFEVWSGMARVPVKELEGHDAIIIVLPNGTRLDIQVRRNGHVNINQSGSKFMIQPNSANSIDIISE